LTGQSAENFKFSTKTSVSARNTYNKFTNLPAISINVNNLSYYIRNKRRYYTTAVKTPPSFLFPFAFACALSQKQELFRKSNSSCSWLTPAAAAPKGAQRQEINHNFITGFIDGASASFAYAKLTFPLLAVSQWPEALSSQAREATVGLAPKECCFCIRIRKSPKRKIG
jgi:hypothetical protein